MTERKSIAESSKRLEFPAVVRQVETHLIFGLLSRYLPLAYIVIAFAALLIVAMSLHLPATQYGSISDVVMFLILPVILLRMTRLQQAIAGFLAVKITQGTVAFAMLTIGVPVSLQHHQSDAVPNLFLGLIWLPPIEFLPSVTPLQKYVTIARLLLTIPCVYFGVRSGYWHWG